MHHRQPTVVCHAPAHFIQPLPPCLLCPAGAKALAAALRDGRAPDLIDLDLKDNPQIKEEGTAALVSALCLLCCVCCTVPCAVLCLPAAAASLRHCSPPCSALLPH